MSLRGSTKPALTKTTGRRRKLASPESQEDWCDAVFLASSRIENPSVVRFRVDWDDGGPRPDHTVRRNHRGQMCRNNVSKFAPGRRRLAPRSLGAGRPFAPSVPHAHHKLPPNARVPKVAFVLGIIFVERLETGFHLRERNSRCCDILL